MEPLSFLDSKMLKDPLIIKMEISEFFESGTLLSIDVINPSTFIYAINFSTTVLEQIIYTFWMLRKLS